MIFIQIDKTSKIPIDRAIIKGAAQATLDYIAHPSQVELTVVLTGDEQLRQLNRQYAENDASTDVLAFPLEYQNPETGALYLGDIIISIQRAAYQAGVGGHSVEDELRLLTVHGVLHLLGYDHYAAPQKAAMQAAQVAILGRLGSAISGVLT